jgi:type 1 glutamine amidotransferase
VAGLFVILAAVYAGISIHRVYYGKHVYETVPPHLPAQLGQPAILVFSKTNGFRQDDAVRGANAALAAIAKERGWSTFFTENGAVFNRADLSRFQATVWNNTSGDVLTPGQKQDFRGYIENGGGFVGIHGAGGDPRYEWRWYVEVLIGTQFKGHPLNPQFQRATIRIEDPNDIAVRDLPREWSREDEWYSFEYSPRSRGVRVLATIDERTYRPKMLWKDISMGTEHPIIWKHCVGKGRAFYSALGHPASTYQEPLHLKELEGAIAWAAGVAGDGCQGTNNYLIGGHHRIEQSGGQDVEAGIR